MNYKETVHWLYEQLPFYQKSGTKAYKKDIDNVVAFFSQNGCDYKLFDSIHIAGTNGKGSVSHMLSSILQESGFKVGLFTSPHLIDFRERIKVNGHNVSKNFVIDFVETNKNSFKELQMSFFEMSVVMAFRYFAVMKVDFAIIEVGLGGRLDATNVLNPKLSIITNISLDHTNLLGNTISEIAIEKAGIIKKNTPILIGEKQQDITIFEDLSKDLDAKLYYAKTHHYDSDLIGIYQKKNINTSVTAVDVLNKLDYQIDNEFIVKGLKNVVNNTGILGRWQIILNKPTVICDIAHNQEALKRVLEQLSINKLNAHIVFGMVKDKNIDSIIEFLPVNMNYYLCSGSNPRVMSQKHISSVFDKYKVPYMLFDFSYDAYSYLVPKLAETDVVLITGSTFIVSDMLKYLEKV